jgi:hypothetical protein
VSDETSGMMMWMTMLSLMGAVEKAESGFD